MRDGGRGRGFERLEDARRSIITGNGWKFGVLGTGKPFAFPSPLPLDTGVTGATFGDDDGGGVDGGTGARPLEVGSCPVCNRFRGCMRTFLLSGLLPDGDWSSETSIRSSSGVGSGVRARFDGLRTGESAGELEDACCGALLIGRDGSSDSTDCGEDSGGEHGTIGGGL